MSNLDTLLLEEKDIKILDNLKNRDPKILLITSKILELADIAKSRFINLYKNEAGFECLVYKPEGVWKIEELRNAFSESERFRSFGCKIVVIEEVDSIEARALPVVLKYLEEVGANTKFVLTARSSNLASVLLSRIEETVTINNLGKGSLSLYYKDLMLNDKDAEWLLENNVPFVLLGRDKKNSEKIDKLRAAVSELDNKNIEIVNKIETIYKSLESIIKLDKKNEKTLLYWYNNILRERALRLLYPTNSKKGYEKIEIINQHEKSLIYNPNLELYIYTLFLKLYK
jgi:hypothetical protein